MKINIPYIEEYSTDGPVFGMHTLAPLEEQVNPVPCQEKGNNPMRDYDSVCDCNQGQLYKTKATAGAGVVINAPPIVETAEEQRKFLTRRALDTIGSKIQQ